jgi:hypothetical protein
MGKPRHLPLPAEQGRLPPGVCDRRRIDLRNYGDWKKSRENPIGM